MASCLFSYVLLQILVFVFPVALYERQHCTVFSVTFFHVTMPYGKLFTLALRVLSCSIFAWCLIVAIFGYMDDFQSLLFHTVDIEWFYMWIIPTCAGAPLG
jgi:hypothetical protein